MNHSRSTRSIYDELTVRDRNSLRLIERFESSEGWVWDADGVGISEDDLQRLIVLNLVVPQQKPDSNYSGYHTSLTGGSLSGRGISLALAGELEVEPMPQGTGEAPADLFDLVIGHEPIKLLLKAVVEAERPVHVLLVGPPATAKSLFLMAMERTFPDVSLWLIGSGMSQMGTWDMVATRRPRFLLVDELDKIKPVDQGALLSLMEGGRVVRAKVGRELDFTLDCRIVAAANRADGFSPELRSRFAVKHLTPYSAGQFAEIVERVLIRQEAASEADARFIAASVRTGDVRDAVRVARLAPKIGVEQAIEVLGLHDHRQ